MCNIVSFDASPNVKVKWNVAKEGMKCEEVSRNLVKMQTAARRKVVFTLMLQQKIFFFSFSFRHVFFGLSSYYDERFRSASDLLAFTSNGERIRTLHENSNGNH